MSDLTPFYGTGTCLFCKRKQNNSLSTKPKIHSAQNSYTARLVPYQIINHGETRKNKLHSALNINKMSCNLNTKLVHQVLEHTVDIRYIPPINMYRYLVGTLHSACNINKTETTVLYLCTVPYPYRIGTGMLPASAIQRTQNGKSVS
jgi:hypothetical protein